MQLDRYFIVPADGRWAVQLGTRVLGTFAEKGEAIQAAIAVANSAGRYGGQAEVLTKGQDGEFSPIWTYGRDAYSSYP